MLQLQTGGKAFRAHSLPLEYTNELAAGRGGPEAIRFLWRTQRSRRLLLLAALFDEVERKPELVEELPPADEARRVIAAAQELAPTVVDELLLHPEVGAWASYTLRRRTDLGLRNGVPPCVDFGGLYVFALVAAARAGLRWSTRLVLRDGAVMLFGLGMARFPGLAGTGATVELVDAVAQDGHVSLSRGTVTIKVTAAADTEQSGEPAGEHWWALRKFGTGRELRWKVWLDDIDPLRDLADPIRPDRLSGAEVASWQDLVEAAWTLLTTYHPESAAEIAVGVVSLAPLPLGDIRETRSASSGEAFGCVMVSPPPDALTLAVSLVHEFQHIKLGGLMHLMQLTDESDVALYYAPWRDDPRPLGGLFQGVYAFFGIAAFWRRHRETVAAAERSSADFEFAYSLGQAQEGLTTLLAARGLTPEGREFAAGLIGQLKAWSAEPLDLAAATAVQILADYHRTGWRIRHQKVNNDQADQLAAAWLGGQHPIALPPELPEVQPSPPERWSYEMTGLIRRSITAPEPLRHASAPGAPAPTVFINLDRPGLSVSCQSAYVALLLGSADAAEGYAAALRDNYKDLDAWCGLTLSLKTIGCYTPTHMLFQRPELVQAAYERLSIKSGASPDPVRFVTWLALARRAPGNARRRSQTSSQGDAQPCQVASTSAPDTSQIPPEPTMHALQ